MKKGNIAIFVPHAGCKNACVFCDQRQISGTKGCPSEEMIEHAVLRAIQNPNLLREETEIAFFGGSFTAIEREEMVRYLDQGSTLVERFGLKGIRLSTRPDAIDEEKIALLKKYRVTTVELGAQSFDDEVLLCSRRGHTGEEIDRAAKLIKLAGISLVLQLMTGLPGDSEQKALSSARRAADLQPDAVRIYPCLVLQGTELAQRYLTGEYRPQTLEEAVNLCRQLLHMFRRRNIPVIKLGLHASSDFEGETLLAGPYHPAFRELVEGAAFVEEVIKRLSSYGKRIEKLQICVAPTFLSTAIGAHKKNVTFFKERLKIEEVGIVPDATVPKGEFELKC